MFTSTNPATGEILGRHDEIDARAIDEALDAAASAYAGWRLAPLDERLALLHAIGDRFEATKRDLAEMATLEMGKTLASAIAEVEKCAASFHYYGDHGAEFLKTVEIETASGHARAAWHPIGPVLAIMPWNFPYWQAVRFLAPAILAGNVGLLKHASNVQGCAGMMARAVRDAGAPDGLFANLAIKSDKVGAIIADDRIRAVTLTGSEGAGMKVAEAAGKALKKVVLELGGSDPFIVMPSADVAKAAKVAAKARTQNSGQSCICAKRMIAHYDIYDDFTEAFSVAMQSVAMGDPMDAATDIGPLSSAEQRDTVVDQVARAQAAGGKLLFGAERRDPGAFMSPGILVDVPRDSDIAGDEIFGPVAMLFRAADLDEAVAIANETAFGLGSSVWTSDDAELARFERDLDCGMVAVNQLLASTSEAPFGGVKRSGHGRELGAWGMHEFMNLKAVMLAD